jgi:hypothetical protein
MSKVEDIKVYREELEAQIEMAKALDRLHDNKDFQMVITEGYLKNHAVMLVQQKRSPGMEDKQEDVLRDLDAIACLFQFFAVTFAIGNNADRQLEEAETAIDDEEGDVVHG